MAGDSRAVLSRGDVAIPLTDDHKAAREDETVSFFSVLCVCSELLQAAPALVNVSLLVLGLVFCHYCVCVKGFVKTCADVLKQVEAHWWNYPIQTHQCVCHRNIAVCLNTSMTCCIRAL